MTTPVDTMGFLACSRDHYSAFILDKNGLTHADSLGCSADPTVLGIICWILAGTGYPSPSYIHKAVTARQNSGGVGSGSCGIAAHDFIVSHFPAKMCTPCWTSTTSPHFRNRALADLITFHLVSVLSNVVCIVFST